MNLEVKIQMLKKGVTQTDIARQLGIDNSTVSCVINNGRQSRRVKEAIAKAVDVPFDKLWGKAA
jgi:transcriptional regulator with XRE-family HTH domain